MDCIYFIDYFALVESPLTIRDRDHLACPEIVNNLTLDNQTDITYTYDMIKPTSYEWECA